MRHHVLHLWVASLLQKVLWGKRGKGEGGGRGGGTEREKKEREKERERGVIF